jgi:UDP-N-acetylmuramate--alanine ligase
VRIHFVGIGGIGISGLAKYMHYRGHVVSGSDMKDTVITQSLREMGMNVNVPHSANAISDDIDLLVHSAIIRPDNPEIQEARKKGVKVLARREALLEILKDKEVYAVAGAHGKSTTTAILSSIMDGSAIIGAESKEFASNVRYDATNDRVIFEADESDGSFLNANATCAIVTNAEPEHMEYYDYNYDLFYDSYKKFVCNAEFRVINAEDPYLSQLTCEATRLYPSKDIKEIEYVLIDDEPHTKFKLKEYGEFNVWGLGEHIAIDASLAILAALKSMDVEVVRENLLNFKGIKKRFDILNKSENVMIDDYAHHPTEIRATLKSVKEYAQLKGYEKITAIWQPHKYSRTIDNLKEFIECFDGASELIILPVYSAGESAKEIDFVNDFSRYNLLMADSVKRSNNILEVQKDSQTIKQLDSGLIVSFGAGDITYQMRGIA